jgi:hypothetical protein
MTHYRIFDYRTGRIEGDYPNVTEEEFQLALLLEFPGKRVIDQFVDKNQGITEMYLGDELPHV